MEVFISFSRNDYALVVIRIAEFLHVRPIAHFEHIKVINVHSTHLNVHEETKEDGGFARSR